MHMVDSAQFYAQQLVALSGGQASDVQLQARCLLECRQYRRCLWLLRQHGHLDTDSDTPLLHSKRIAVQCMVSANLLPCPAPALLTRT